MLIPISSQGHDNADVGGQASKIRYNAAIYTSLLQSMTLNLSSRSIRVKVSSGCSKQQYFIAKFTKLVKQETVARGTLVDSAMHLVIFERLLFVGSVCLNERRRTRVI